MPLASTRRGRPFIHAICPPDGNSCPFSQCWTSLRVASRSFSFPVRACCNRFETSRLSNSFRNRRSFVTDFLTGKLFIGLVPCSLDNVRFICENPPCPTPVPKNGSSPKLEWIADQRPYLG